MKNCSLSKKTGSKQTKTSNPCSLGGSEEKALKNLLIGTSVLVSSMGLLIILLLASSCTLIFNQTQGEAEDVIDAPHKLEAIAELPPNLV